MAASRTVMNQLKSMLDHLSPYFDFSYLRFKAQWTEPGDGMHTMSRSTPIHPCWIPAVGQGNSGNVHSTHSQPAGSIWAWLCDTDCQGQCCCLDTDPAHPRFPFLSYLGCRCGIENPSCSPVEWKPYTEEVRAGGEEELGSSVASLCHTSVDGITLDFLL